ncbi:hypothetical protein M422DRAFT_256656 [Sphaerobolus stellatus SS14]|uniref:Uncharacterized protein n=1 Tax=Sphaerobolus stellatus (strain SS14) TaxID=990650 RepID=A0A0C9VG96_SPHS4|nr:hypothetical protein M422DRAFT_256656 [Sphaerobolus stellatus SS14]
MSHKRGITRRARVDELSVQAVDDGEPTPGLTAGNLANSPSPSVDPQQRLEMLALEPPRTTHRGSASPRGVADVSGTATQGSYYCPRGIGLDSGSGQNLGDAPSDPERVSSDPRDTEDEDFTIPASEVSLLWWEYADFVNLKENAEIVVSKAMEATEQVNTVFTRIRASMNSMSPRMKELFLVPSKKASGKMSMMEPAPGSGAEEHPRTTQSCLPGDQYSQSHTVPNIQKNIQRPARGEQSDDSQPRCGREVNTGPSLLAEQVIQGVPESIECSQHSIIDPQSIDMNALREEIKETISATIKDKLCLDADSVTTVSQSISALDANAQYWSDLSNKAARHSHRAFELQLKLVEEKVNTLLHEEAPEEALLEAAWEAQTIHFQLDQNT